MAITTLPTFEDDEILSAAKLNELRDAIETKFAGAITGSDITWPLVAQGNLDMAGFSILGAKVFWNIINADEYTTLQAAIDAAEATSGGAVFVPPNTTIEAQGLTVDVGDIAFFGAGVTSSIKFPTSPASDMFTSAASLAGLRFSNLKFDGNSGAGTALNALTLKNVTECHIDNCTFADFSGDAINLTDDLGAACDEVIVGGCDFSEIEGYGISSEGLTSAQFHGNIMHSTAGLGGMNISPTAGAQAEFVIVINNHIDVTGHGIRMVSNGGSDYGDNVVSNNYVKASGTTKTGIIVGEAGVPMKNCAVSNNTVESCTDIGISTNGPGMVVNANIVRDASDDGYSFVSDDLTVTGNVAKSCGGNGVTIANCSEITMGGNFCVDNTGYGYDVSNIDFGFFSGNGAQNNTAGVALLSGLTNCQSDASNVFGGVSSSNLVDNTLTLGGTFGFGNNTLVGANNGSNPSDGFETSAGGSGLVHRAKVEVLQTVSSPATLWTVPVGEIWMVHRAYVRTSTAWDGAGTDLDIGISGGDVDGFIDGSAITGFPETAQIYAEDPAEQGTLLYSARALDSAIDATAGAIDIIATVTAGGGTTGVSDVFLEYSVIEAD